MQSHFKMINISEFYKGKDVFITGATGFMGKVLMEKILRSCSNVGNVYILIRPKKGKDPSTRIKEIVEDPFFESLRQKHPENIKKIIPVLGDCMELGLGLTSTDRHLLIENVSLVFHCAASVRFDDPLKKAILLNTRGTREMFMLAKEMKNLKRFISRVVSSWHLRMNLRTNIVSTLEDPISGWIDNFNGPIGLTIGAGKGILRTIFSSPHLNTDYVPVDVCIKGVILAAWDKGVSGLCKIQRKVFMANMALQFFTTRSWSFSNKNCLALRARTLKEDKKEFFLDHVEDVNPVAHFRNCAIGARKYLLKEHPDTIPQSKKHYRRLYWIDKSLHAILIILVLWILFFLVMKLNF
ncbi:hypothetical protein C0J52_06906 [Blattella germanica]|nr:hypothetical protein C0J52_06906 [Blattella germanica]